MSTDQTVANTLPALRQELTLTEGASTPSGEPTWVLQDPIANRFYQLGWAAFEILSRWDLGTAEQIIAAVNEHTTLRIDHGDVEGLVQFLAQHHLLLAETARDTERLAHHAAAGRLRGAKWLLKNYLFFRVPLVRPRRLLEWLAPVFAVVFTRAFWWTVLGALVLGIYLVSRQWDSFTHTFSAYSGWQALLGIGIALSFAKVLHECGHALTANHYGCRVPTMGVAFLVMLPVLYTDTTDAWKLRSRRQRMQIGAAGMLAELVLAVVATLAWSFLPDGPLRAGVFLLATSTWLITLLLNASPFMRFDGYFLLADWLNLPNLHERAFALGRWRLREWLFGWGDPVPEQFSPERQRFLIGFAFATAIYRAILFLSIALLVYHLFFKLLGLLLMLVELAWFIAYPVQREVSAWWQRRGEMRWNLQTRRSAMLAAAALALLTVPWQSSIRAPAVLMPEQAQGLYAVSAAQVKTAGIADGARVMAGQQLVQLESPDLQHRLKLAQAREQQLRWQLEQQTLAADLQLAGPALRKHWEGAREAVRGLEERTAQLTVTAPFDGIVAERNPALAAGAWIPAGEKLFYIVGPTGMKAEAYLNESDMLRFAKIEAQSKRSARFVAQQPGMPALDCNIDAIDRLNLGQLDQPSVASPYGGAIAAQKTAEGHLEPLTATFRVRLGHCTNASGPHSLRQELTGTASLQGARESFLARAVNKVVAVLHSESGF